ncbi:terminase [Brucella endophytica]|uniref:Terminase n=1 Tax=Brucella endophytica TaxID=1963359 RepID=A0A916S2U2_9HYPH|nr:phage terminase small subunit P27 family [Brucella endophytica]GGA81186.1 terminase [Brucella endophytica]
MKGTKPHLVVDNSGLKRVPAAPSWLSKDAKAEWRRVMPELVERRILTRGDLGSLENYCISIGRVREVEAQMQGCDDPELMVKLFRVQDKAMQSARLLAAELGLTPVSRSRPSIRGDEDDDSLLD